jgi:hypothetical protein
LQKLSESLAEMYDTITTIISRLILLVIGNAVLIPLIIVLASIAVVYANAKFLLTGKFPKKGL